MGRANKKSRSPTPTSLLLYVGAAVAGLLSVVGLCTSLNFLRDAFSSTATTPERRPTLYMGPRRILTASDDQLTEAELELKEEIKNYNFEPKGPGAFNKPVALSENLKQLSEQRYAENNFDVVVSDLVSINRELVDVRNAECQRKFKPGKDVADLPNVSLIIVFHNEAFSTLIRTLHSVLRRTPLSKLKEIILVDDMSDRNHLREPLEEYLKEFPLAARIKMIRLEQRSGLIKARLTAVEAAQGDVMLFLDAHVEVTKGWLEPLLVRVQQNPQVIVAPLIDVVDLDNFEYRTTIDGLVGQFNWRLTYSWGGVDDVEMRRRGADQTEPYRTPVIAGGLFAVRKDWFYKLGTYDENMKAWRCGGSLEIHPCSRVGHVFRKVTPYTFPGGVEEMIAHNEIRTAKVWLDEYQPFYFETHPFSKKIDVGSVEDRLAIKQRLECKSFRWYITEVYRNSPFPIRFEWMGRIRSVVDEHCIDTRQRKEGELYVAAYEDFGNHQLWVLDSDGYIYNDHACITVTNDDIQITPFDHTKKTCQQFAYNPETLQLVHKPTQKCIARRAVLAALEECQPVDTAQWKIEVLAQQK